MHNFLFLIHTICHVQVIYNVECITYIVIHLHYLNLRVLVYRSQVRERPELHYRNSQSQRRWGNIWNGCCRDHGIIGFVESYNALRFVLANINCLYLIRLMVSPLYVSCFKRISPWIFGRINASTTYLRQLKGTIRAPHSAEFKFIVNT